MKKFLPLLTALTCLVLAPASQGADAKAELQDLVGKVKAKLQAGKSTEADLAPELQSFDALLAEHKGEKTNEVADILMLKAQLYSEVSKTMRHRHRRICSNSRPNFPTPPTPRRRTVPSLRWPSRRRPAKSRRA